LTTPHIDHIGIMVADLEQAAAKLRPLFGEHASIRELPEAGLRVAEFHAAKPQQTGFLRIQPAFQTAELIACQSACY
jgi:hypothetical protein